MVNLNLAIIGVIAVAGIFLFREAGQLGKGIQDALGGIEFPEIPDIGKGFEDGLTNLQDGFSESFSNLQDSFTDGLTGIQDGLSNAFSNAGDVIQDGLEGAGDVIQDGLEGAGDAVQDGLDAVQDGLEGAGDAVQDGLEGAGDFFEDAGDNIQDGVDDFIEGVDDIFKNIQDGLDEFGESLFPGETPGARPRSVQSEIDGQQFEIGGPGGGGGVVRESEFTEIELRQMRFERDSRPDIADARARADESLQEALEGLDRTRAMNLDRDAENQERADEANMRDQGEFFGLTPREIALRTTGGNINNF